MKWVKFILGCAGLLAAATFTAVRFGGMEVRRLQTEVDQLEQERTQLLEYARRLGAARRVAQVDVVRQRKDQLGRTVSTLLWQEIGPDGMLGQPVAVETVGKLVYFESLVLKFQQKYVGEADPVRGASLAMFRRIFGDCQAPDSVLELDRFARPPRSLESEENERLCAELWDKFWEFVEDPRLAEEFGVRVAQCEAPAVPLDAGQTWVLTLDAAGGLNLRRIDARPGAAADAWPRCIETPGSMSAMAPDSALP